MRLRIPLAVQVGAVVALLAASLATLWRTGASVVERERRREGVLAEVVRADDALAGGGAPVLAVVPVWPDTLDPDEWAQVDRLLAERARKALAPIASARLEGGFFIPAEDRYLGYAQVPVAGSTGAAPGDPPRRGSDPPEREADLVTAQVRDALARERPLELVLDRPSGSVALRAAPVWVDGRKVAATWTLARLDDAGSLGDVLAGYRRAAGLALGGVALSLVLTAGLARTVRNQAREQLRIQAELRRSERLAALGRLLGGVAHEVRNPLAGLRSTAQLWQRGVPPDAEAIAGVIAEVDRIEGLVARLLQFSKAEPPPREPGDLNAIVAEAARLAGPAAEAQGVHVQVDLDPALPAVPLAAPAVLQVLRNLTANALQAMPGGGRLVLATRPGPDAGVIAVVRDTGPGLSPETRAHLFEPFFTTRPDGTGLGLALAREIALAHGGDLHADPAGVREGAAFSLVLPAAPG
jgi:signal transduction histidine kinase